MKNSLELNNTNNMNKYNRDVSISGTEIKINVHIDPIGTLHMDAYDFECKFYIFPKKFVIVKKEDMVKVDEDNYLAIVDTTDLGIGRLHMTLTAQVPDYDFNNILRREIACVDTGIEIIPC